MKLKSLFITVMAGAAMLVGCNKEVDLGPAKLVVETGDITLSSSEVSQDVIFTATRDWKVTGIPEWMAASPESGVGSVDKQKVRLSVNANTEYNRSAEVVFTIGFARTAIKVEQEGPKGVKTEGSGTKEDPFTVTGVINYVSELGADVSSPNKVYVKGKISRVKDNGFTTDQYGNGTFYISDDGTPSNEFYAYRILYLGNAKFKSGDTQIAVGDDVIIYGNVVNYKGTTPETVQNSAFLYELNGVNKGGDEGGSGGADPKGTGTLDDPFNAAAANAALKAGTITEGQTYYVSGKISKIANNGEFSAQYGNGTFYINDSGAEADESFYCYRVLFLGNQKWAAGNTQIKVGDDVVIAGELVMYNGTPETSANKAYIYSLNGKTEDGGDPNPPAGDIKAVSIAEFLAAPESDTQKYELVGTIGGTINETYGNFDLTDETGTVYVYGLTATDLGYGSKNDKSYASLGLKEGDKIKIIGYRGSYGDKIEVLNAYFVEKVSGGDPNPPTPGEVKAVSVADFIAAPESDTQKYELVGTIGGTINETYGNFDLTDETGTVYVYGLTATDLGYGSKNDKSYASLGLKEGDKIKIIGYRGSYGDKIEVLNAYFVEKVSGGDPNPPTPGEVKAVSVADFIAAPESDTQKYELVGTIGGTINETYGNFDLTDETGTVYVYGLTATDLGYGSKNDKSYASLGLKEGDKIKIIGYRGSYNEKIEVLYAYFVEKVGGEDPNPPTPGEVKAVSVADFIAAPESDTQKYELVGTIGGTINETYGNFDLTDETGTVYVYGLTATDLGYGSKNDKSFASLGLKEGDKIKIIGYRGSYNEKIEVLNAYFVEKVSGGEDPNPPTPGEVKAVSVADFIAAPESDTQKYELVGTIGGSINTTYGNFDLTDETGTVYVYGLTATDLGYGSKNDKSYASLGLNEGDKIKIIGYRGSYNEKIEVLYAYFVEKISSGENPGNPDNPGDDPTTGGDDDGSVSFNQDQLAAAACGGAKVEMNSVISFTNSSNYGDTAVTELRVYKSQTWVVSAASGYKITKIEITCTANGTTKQGPGCFGAGAPEGYTYEGAEGVWAGSQASVSFTATDNQVRIKALKVSYVKE